MTTTNEATLTIEAMATTIEATGMTMRNEAIGMTTIEVTGNMKRNKAMLTCNSTDKRSDREYDKE